MNRTLMDDRLQKNIEGNKWRGKNKQPMASFPPKKTRQISHVYFLKMDLRTKSSPTTQ